MGDMGSFCVQNREEIHKTGWRLKKLAFELFTDEGRASRCQLMGSSCINWRSSSDMIRKRFSRETIGICFFAALLLIQALSLVCMGLRKEGMHIDEYYSYILSNSYDSDCISSDDTVWNRWLAGESFQKYLTVENGERFTYGRVYYNNTLDAHPPLFYFLLHTVCSFFSGQYSPWFGMGLNIALILATQIVLFLLTRRITGNTLWGGASVAIYGGTQAFFDTGLFIRMYALLTLLTVLLLLVHYSLLTKPRKRTILGCAAITFLGVFTQYYFAFFAFFLALTTCIWFLCRREYKKLMLYAAAMLLAVVLVFVVYPAGITQITGSETNNVGKEVWANLFNFSGWIGAVLSMVQQAAMLMLLGLWQYKWLAACIVVLVVLIAFWIRRKAPESVADDLKKEFLSILTLCLMLAATVFLIAHISGKFTYVRYIYNILPIVALASCLIVRLIARGLRLQGKLIAAGVVVVWLLGTVGVLRDSNCSYLYTERAEQDREIIQLYENGKRPLIMLNKRSNYQPTGLMHYLLAGEDVFLGDYTQIADMEAVLSSVDCSDGVVFIVLTDQYWSNGFDGDEVMREVVSDCAVFGGYEQVGSCDFSTAYLAKPTQ